MVGGKIDIMEYEGMERLRSVISLFSGLSTGDVAGGKIGIWGYASPRGHSDNFI